MSINTASPDSSCDGKNSTIPTTLRPQNPPSRYESQKRRDWNTFGQYLKNHRPPLALARCSGAHVLEFLRYLDRFGKTKVHIMGCPFFGQPNPPAPCPCPLRQAWGSLDALIGRLRAAFEENGGLPETNPFGARAVRLYLREVRDSQSKARGIAYEKKKRKKTPSTSSTMTVGTAENQNLNNSASMEYDRQMPYHHGRHFLHTSSSGDFTSTATTSTSNNTGGGVPVSLYGTSDDRLLLFQCAPGPFL